MQNDELLSLKALSASIGADPMLVQGAGGNTSIKIGSQIWVKASGTWLQNALTEEIFIPIDLRKFHRKLNPNIFELDTSKFSLNSKRPSIETLLHVIMPQKVIVHTHAVEVLSILVRKGSESKIRTIIGDQLNWMFVEYAKPGNELAEKIFSKISTKKNTPDILFLESHGLVLATDTVDEARKLLEIIKRKFKITPNYRTKNFNIPVGKKILDVLKNKNYKIMRHPELEMLVKNKMLLLRVQKNWQLYPDHIVFLGASPVIIDESSTAIELDRELETQPPFVFVSGNSIFQSKDCSKAQIAQLKCYYEVIIRCPDKEPLLNLGKMNISKLLSWDAEKYRQKINKKIQSTVA